MTSVVDDTTYSSASTLWMWTKVGIDSWTQIFGGKVAKPETSRSVEKQFLPTLATFGAPNGSDAIGIS